MKIQRRFAMLLPLGTCFWSIASAGPATRSVLLPSGAAGQVSKGLAFSSLPKNMASALALPPSMSPGTPQAFPISAIPSALMAAPAQPVTLSADDSVPLAHDSHDSFGALFRFDIGINEAQGAVAPLSNLLNQGFDSSVPNAAGLMLPGNQPASNDASPQIKHAAAAIADFSEQEHAGIPLNDERILVASPAAKYQERQARILKGESFKEFSHLLKRMHRDVSDAIRVEVDDEVRERILSPLKRDLQAVMDSAVSYPEFLSLTARYGVAMDIRLDNIDEELIGHHREFDEEDARGIHTAYIRSVFPPIKLSERYAWHQKRLEWMLGTHPGSPRETMQHLGSGDDKDNIQIPSFRPLDFSPFFGALGGRLLPGMVKLP